VNEIELMDGGMNKDELAALKRDAERWREVERRARYWYRTYWILNTDRVGGFVEAIDAAIKERKRKDGAE